MSEMTADLTARLVEMERTLKQLRAGARDSGRPTIIFRTREVERQWQLLAELRAALEAVTRERDEQRKAADHWFQEANKEHNRGVKLEYELDTARDRIGELEAREEERRQDAMESRSRE